MQLLAQQSVQNGKYSSQPLKLAQDLASIPLTRANLKCFYLFIYFFKFTFSSTAIAKAVSDGHREFTAIAVVAMQEKYFTSPCGVCRQTLSEFVRKDIPVYIAKPAACRVLITSVAKLLPGAFVPPCNEDNLHFK